MYILLINNYSASSTVLIKTCYNFLLIQILKTSRKITIKTSVVDGINYTPGTRFWLSPSMNSLACVLPKQSYYTFVEKTF